MDSTDLCFTSAVDLAVMIETKEISPVEFVSAVLQRIEASQSTLNAFIAVRHESALKEAQRAETRALKGMRLGPLDGIPFSAKDLIWTRDLKTTFGSQVFKDFIPPEDAPAVARLRSAGAILIGKTTTPEFGHKPITDSPLFGITINPWHPQRSPGGSSGGAAAAIAAGLAPLALGSDGGGSIRIPASCTGIVGLKPTLGRVPHPHAPDLFGNLSYIGPMTRTVSDTAIMLDTICGQDIKDPHSVGLEKKSYWPIVKGLNFKELKVAWIPHMGNSEIEEETLAYCLQAVSDLAELGAQVTEVDPEFKPNEEVFLTHLKASLAARLGKYVAQYGSQMDSSLLLSIEQGKELTAIKMQEVIQQRSKIYQEVQHLFQSYDLVVSPTLSRPALSINHKAWEPIEIDDKQVGSLRSAWYPYTHPFNMSSNPAISIPCGWTRDNLPVGFQIVGRLFDEKTLLETAMAMERIRPWTQRRPPELF